MGKLGAFNFTTLNGFYKGLDEDISWHPHGKEENDYAAQSLKGGSILLFGRITFQMMASYWPTQMAIENNPTVAKGMNAAEKIVFSKTLRKVEWNNTKLIKDHIIDEVKKLKQTSKKDLTILGSGSIITQFAEAGLIDDYQFMIDPVAIGNGTPMFNKMKGKLDLELIHSKIFKSGVVLLTYKSFKK